MPGQSGGHKSVLLELKLIADVALVGFPNVSHLPIFRILFYSSYFPINRGGEGLEQGKGRVNSVQRFGRLTIVSAGHSVLVAHTRPARR